MEIWKWEFGNMEMWTRQYGNMGMGIWNCENYCIWNLEIWNMEYGNMEMGIWKYGIWKYGNVEWNFLLRGCEEKEEGRKGTGARIKQKTTHIGSGKNVKGRPKLSISACFGWGPSNRSKRLLPTQTFD